MAAATIPVERFFGDVLLVAGGDDRVWPSLDFARGCASPPDGIRPADDSRDASGGRPPGGAAGRVPRGGWGADGPGGTEASDRALGVLAWPEIRRVLGAPTG